MPVQSRRVTVKKQQRNKQVERMKKIRKAFNTGLIMFSTAAFIESTTKPSNVMAQTTSNTRLSKSEFLNLVTDSAKKIAASNDLYASVMIAQAVLESGWGNSTLARAPYHNLFGIKGSSSDNTVNMDTLEDDGTGNYYVANEAFKRYDDYAGSLQDYANILTGDNGANSWRYNYYLGARVSQTNSYQDATRHLTGRYATDTSYASKLNAIIQQNNLTAYDTVGNQSNNNQNNNNNQGGTEENTTNNGTTTNYVVEAGDTYWSLARKFGLDVKSLQNANNATNGNLFVGQAIRIPGVANTEKNETEKETTVETPTTPTQQGQYTVKAGDTYWSLARRLGVSAGELQRLNNTSSSSLYVGQKLVVPGQTTQASTENNSPKEESTNSTPTNTKGNYTVKAGDTYWSLARRYNVSVESLMAQNGQNLIAGKVITIPSVATTQTDSTPVTEKEEATTTPVSTSNGNYTVVAGDTLWSIASRHQTTVGQILSANGLAEGTVLHPGQSLVVSGSTVANNNTSNEPTTSTSTTDTTSATTTVTETPAPTTTVTSTTGSYTVVAGDTLYSIARRSGIDVNTLIAANGGSTIISVGQVINY
ncbi:muramidase family protein [Globicatella sanguinis]|uniref:muramidase family protein n=1 Tax=Globicatella sanguinis TaxID=13076 RepID=UPI00082708E2|nr:LysM peptidoglycan-binding domain-containing protein [Globicatella sanguinis]